MTNDIQFQIECLATELAGMLIDEYGWDLSTALDALYRSETFEKVCDPLCGLYYEGPVYVFSFLKNEIELGRIA